MAKTPDELKSGDPTDDRDRITQEEGLHRAESILSQFNYVLEDIEGDEDDEDPVDLNEISDTHSTKPSDGPQMSGGIWIIGSQEKIPWTKRQALKETLEQAENYMEYLPEESQDEARALIIRAKIYLKDDELKQKK